MIPKVLQHCIASLGALILLNSVAVADPKGKAEASSSSSVAVSNDTYMGLSGEELWSNNCLRCHNIRPPGMYTDAQWDVIVHHMRLRANITGQEQRAIVEFLKSAK